MKFKYLHEVSPDNYYLDHRLTPEVRALLCAQASRMPKGGIRQRYRELVSKVAASVEGVLLPSDPVIRAQAEDRLCEYPLHPVVQEFFDKNIGKYGHGSVLELTGSPSVYTENVSPYTAYLSFDSPLCSGQEMSTRAVYIKDWPICREAKGDSELEDLHWDWLHIFEAEKDAWKERFSDPEIRKEYGIADDEPFRPAFDRARWALPGTIAVGFSHTGHVRERARVIRDAKLRAKDFAPALAVWEEVEATYRAAVPGIAKYGLREAVHSSSEVTRPPSHLDHTPHRRATGCWLLADELHAGVVPMRQGSKTYLDPEYNRHRVSVVINPSFAAARDWHRHRTFYPWRMSFGRAPRLSAVYSPIATSIAKVNKLMGRSANAYNRTYVHSYRGILALPLGTETTMAAAAGLRDAVYTLELRGKERGTNFEYRAQAQRLMRELRTGMEHQLGGAVTVAGILGDIP